MSSVQAVEVPEDYAGHDPLRLADQIERLVQERCQDKHEHAELSIIFYIGEAIVIIEALRAEANNLRIEK